MSGQWEVVGKKNKGSKNGKQPAISKEQQKLINGVKVEEVLPLSQLKNLYSSKGNNKENHKPPQEKKKDNNGSGQPQQPKQKANSNKKPQNDNKPKQYKSIEIAYNAIKPDELSNNYDNNKVVYPTMPIVWLRELAQFLNMHINVEVPDITFANKPDNYPLCTMPGTIRSILEKGLKQAGAENCALFYDICLASMANDMNKNLPAMGHKLFIQLLSHQQHKLAIGNISKYVALRNSYQNRPNIGLSILWALGQCGLKDLQVGIRVFHEFMYPVIEMKNYTRFAVNYLVAILKKHAKSATLSLEQYFTILDIIYTNKKNMTSELSRELYDTMPMCNTLLLANSEKKQAFIEPVLKRLSQTSNKACKNYLCEVLLKCLESDDACLAAWGKSYNKYLAGSASLLQHIDYNWRNASSKLNVKQLKSLLLVFSTTNTDLCRVSSKTKDEALDECIKAVMKLNNKMAGNKKKTNSKCRFLAYLGIVVLSAFIYVDVRQNGSWTNSCTSKALNRTGVYTYTHKAYDRASECTQWMFDNFEKTFPDFTRYTIQYSKPYLELGHDVCLVLKNIGHNINEGIQSKVPIVIDTIETYAPGLIDQTQELGRNIWAKTIVYYEIGHEYLMTQVFIGKFAPEEIQKTVASSMHTGYEKAQEYYSWLYNKIMSAIK